MKVVQLSDLKQGQKAKILGFYPSDPDYQYRLGSLGLLPGAIITVERIAPLGDPIQIELRHSRLCLRKAEANALKLELI